jgi:hypothetical protein
MYILDVVVDLLELEPPYIQSQIVLPPLLTGAVGRPSYRINSPRCLSAHIGAVVTTVPVIFRNCIGVVHSNIRICIGLLVLQTSLKWLLKLNHTERLFQSHCTTVRGIHISPTSGGRSVGIVRSLAQATEFVFINIPFSFLFTLLLSAKATTMPPRCY